MRITAITKFHDRHLPGESKNYEGEKYDGVIDDNYDGFIIETDVNDFMIAINSTQDCSENFGHICSEDNLDTFIGARILNYNAVKPETWEQIPLHLTKDIDYDKYWHEAFEAAFIDFETDIGKLQFAVYNIHNGYYGHRVFVKKMGKPMILTEKTHPKYLNADGEVDFNALTERALSRFREQSDVPAINFVFAIPRGHIINADITDTKLSDCYQMVVTFHRPRHTRKRALENGDEEVISEYYS